MPLVYSDSFVNTFKSNEYQYDISLVANVVLSIEVMSLCLRQKMTRLAVESGQSG